MLLFLSLVVSSIYILLLLLVVFFMLFFQCFDDVGWVTGCKKLDVGLLTVTI